MFLSFNKFNHHLICYSSARIHKILYSSFQISPKQLDYKIGKSKTPLDSGNLCVHFALLFFSAQRFRFQFNECLLAQPPLSGRSSWTPSSIQSQTGHTKKLLPYGNSCCPHTGHLCGFVISYFRWWINSYARYFITTLGFMFCPYNTFGNTLIQHFIL